MTASRRPWNRDPCFDGPPERGKTRPLSLANGEQLAQFLARPLVHSRSDTHRSNIAITVGCSFAGPPVR